jgi:hypothetical protein
MLCVWRRLISLSAGRLRRPVGYGRLIGCAEQFDEGFTTAETTVLLAKQEWFS